MTFTKYLSIKKNPRFKSAGQNLVYTLKWKTKL